MARGGKREGAGSKKGRAKLSKQVSSNEERRALASLIRPHVEEIVDTALSIMRRADTDAARMSAINFLADRGWGRAVQGVSLQTGDGDDVSVAEIFKSFAEMMDKGMQSRATG